MSIELQHWNLYSPVGGPLWESKRSNKTLPYGLLSWKSKTNNNSSLIPFHTDKWSWGVWLQWLADVSSSGCNHYWPTQKLMNMEKSLLQIKSWNSLFSSGVLIICLLNLSLRFKHWTWLCCAAIPTECSSKALDWVTLRIKSKTKSLSLSLFVILVNNVYSIMSLIQALTCLLQRDIWKGW